jgi:hypothetical protein
MYTKHTQHFTSVEHFCNIVHDVFMGENVMGLNPGTADISGERKITAQWAPSKLPEMMFASFR